MRALVWLGRVAADSSSPLAQSSRSTLLLAATASCCPSPAHSLHTTSHLLARASCQPHFHTSRVMKFSCKLAIHCSAYYIVVLCVLLPCTAE